VQQEIYIKDLDEAVILNEIIDLEASPADIYYLKIRTDNSRVFSRKIIKIAY